MSQASLNPFVSVASAYLGTPLVQPSGEGRLAVVSQPPYVVPFTLVVEANEFHTPERVRAQLVEHAGRAFDDFWAEAGKRDDEDWEDMWRRWIEAGIMARPDPHGA